MKKADARAAVLSAIALVAPDVDPDDLDEAARLREDLELDSPGFLRLIDAIAQSTGVEVPERDYPQVVTVTGLIAYLAASSPAG